MRSFSTWSRIALVASILLVGAGFGCRRSAPPPAAPPSPSQQEQAPLRLGWQPPWANQGQIVEILKHTDVLARHHVKVDFLPFTFGGPMTEAALAGQLDIFFAGEQPAMTLIGRDPNWRFVARMVNYRSAIVVPIESPIKSIADLKGKTIGTAFGSTTHRDAVRILGDAGLQYGHDYELISIDQAEHAAVIEKGGRASWSGVDAIATYDPTIAIAVSRGLARVVTEWRSHAVVTASLATVEHRHTDLANFLAAYIEAFAIYAKNPQQANAWFEVDSRLPLTAAVYQTIANYEPNLSATSTASVNILLDDAFLSESQRNVSIAQTIGLLRTPIDVRSFVQLDAAREAMITVAPPKP